MWDVIVVAGALAAVVIWFDLVDRVIYPEQRAARRHALRVAECEKKKGRGLRPAREFHIPIPD